MSGSSGNIYAPASGDLSAANSNFGGLLTSAVGGVNNYSPGVTSQVQNITAGATNNPYFGGAINGAQQAGAYGTGTLAPQLTSAANSNFATGSQAAGYIPQTLATGYDPNNALYNQQFQQNQDQSNAVNAMNGVAGTPYGAGVSNQSNLNFNTNWQANQQARQQAAATTANTLAGTQANADATGNTLGTAAMNTQTTASALPYTTQEQEFLTSLQALTGGTAAVSGATGATTDVLSNILQYLGYGTQATTAQQNQSNQTYSGIGQGLGGLFGLNTGGGGTLGGDLLAAL